MVVEEKKPNQNLAHNPIILCFYVDNCLVRFLYNRGQVIAIAPTYGVDRDIQSRVARHPQ
jgi:hypothetical protein